MTERKSAEDDVIITQALQLVQRVCQRYLSPADADDAVQATFMVFWKKRRQVMGHPNVLAWFQRTADLVCREHRRRSSRRQRHEQRAGQETAQYVKSVTSRINDELPRIVEESLASLPAHYSEVLLRSFVYDQPRSRIAAELNVAEGTVGSWLHRGRQRLAQILRQRGVTAVNVTALLAGAGLTSNSAAQESLTLTANAPHGGISSASVGMAEQALRAMLVQQFAVIGKAVAAVLACILPLGGVVLADDGPQPVREVVVQAQPPATFPAVAWRGRPDLRDLPLYEQLIDADDQAERLRVWQDIYLTELTWATGLAGPALGLLRDGWGIRDEDGPLDSLQYEAAPPTPQAIVADQLPAWASFALVGQNPFAWSEYGQLYQDHPWYDTLQCLMSRDWRPLWQRAQQDDLDPREQLILVRALLQTGARDHLRCLRPAAGQSAWAWACLRWEVAREEGDLRVPIIIELLQAAFVDDPDWQTWIHSAPSDRDADHLSYLATTIDQLHAEPPVDDAARWRNHLRQRALLVLIEQRELKRRVRMTFTPRRDNRDQLRDIMVIAHMVGDEQWQSWQRAWDLWRADGGGNQHVLQLLGNLARTMPFTYPENHNLGRSATYHDYDAEACRLTLHNSISQDRGNGLLQELWWRWQLMPVVHDLEVAGTFISQRIDLDDIAQAELDLPEDHYAIVWTGTLTVLEDGYYQFTLDSDDGSRLFIGDDLVVDHHGHHAMAWDSIQGRGERTLKAGRHPVRIEYYEGIGGAGIKLNWQVPGQRHLSLIGAPYLHHGSDDKPGLQGQWYHLPLGQRPEDPASRTFNAMASWQRSPWQLRHGSVARDSIDRFDNPERFIALAQQILAATSGAVGTRYHLARHLFGLERSAEAQAVLAEGMHVYPIDAPYPPIVDVDGRRWSWSPGDAELRLLQAMHLAATGDPGAEAAFKRCRPTAAAQAYAARWNEEHDQPAKALAAYQRLVTQSGSAALDIRRLSVAADQSLLAGLTEEALIAGLADRTGAFGRFAMACWQRGTLAELRQRIDTNHLPSADNLALHLLIAISDGEWDLAQRCFKHLHLMLPRMAASQRIGDLQAVALMAGHLVGWQVQNSAAITGDTIIDQAWLSPEIRTLWRQVRSATPPPIITPVADADVTWWAAALQQVGRGDLPKAVSLMDSGAVYFPGLVRHRAMVQKPLPVRPESHGAGGF